ncbi:MAG: polysaccharide biosynthesis/export family protein [Thermoguttaceae bacterium]
MTERRLRVLPQPAATPAVRLLAGWLAAATWGLAAPAGRGGPVCPEPTLPEAPLSSPASDRADPTGPASEQVPGLLAHAGACRQVRSWQLEAAARQADLLTQQGFELAERKAYFSARAEFFAALRLVAQALDEQEQTGRHTAALGRALTALGEAQDFSARLSRPEAEPDLAGLIAVHQTPILKKAAGPGLSLRTALQSYLTYAQEQFAAAAGEELAGSMALYALGKLDAALADQQATSTWAARPQAMLFYQAALLSWPENPMAANDLGVLLAQAGRYEDARTVLEYCVKIEPLAGSWRNLSLVYRQLGQEELAERARQQWVAAVQPAPRSPQVEGVRWVAPESFFRQGVSSSASGPGPATVGTGRAMPGQPSPILLCEALGPEALRRLCTADCSTCKPGWRGGWEAVRARFWRAYVQGEYIGQARPDHPGEYRLRVDDQLDIIYRLTRQEIVGPYRLGAGDQLRVESFTDPVLNRELTIEPDGMVTLRLLGQVRASGKTVPQLRDELERLYLKYYRVPAITVTPLRLNARLEELRAAVDRRQATGGQGQLVRVSPEGSIWLPAIGQAPAEGLTLAELQKELNLRYREQIEGIEVVPILVERAPCYVYVLGGVRAPGRYELTGPTNLIQAISMAGSWQPGANLRQVVLFRRGDDCRLIGTIVNLHGTLRGKQTCPDAEILLADSDVVLVPKCPVLMVGELVEEIFRQSGNAALSLCKVRAFCRPSAL